MSFVDVSPARESSYIKKATEVRVCSRCVMDDTDPDIRFDEHGVCNHCRGYEEMSLKRAVASDVLQAELTRLLSDIKKSGKGKEYDCIIGLSGGVDSSYVALQVKRLGLRPLAVHLDNAWNSELAVSNIERIVRTLDIDLVTHVLDWEEFRDLQLSFIRAGVVDIEMLTDHAITAVLFRNAIKHHVKYIISGNNTATESVMPAKWKHRKSDLKNIRSIHGRYGNLEVKQFPVASSFALMFYKYVKGIRQVSLLNYLEYNKMQAISELESALGWINYGGKHYESIFTRFYQAYILPQKFGIDKRKAHLSTLICSGQLLREEALHILEQPLYESEAFRGDRALVLKKLGLSDAEFETYISAPPRSHYEFESDQKMVDFFDRLKEIVRKLVFRGGIVFEHR